MALDVDAAIPYGNVCDVSVDETVAPAEVSFAPSPHGGPETLWFCFRIWRQGGLQAPVSDQIRLVLKHGYNMLGGNDPTAMRPVVRRTGDEWERLGEGTVEHLPDGRWRVSWLVDAPTSYLDVAYCYPYGLSEMESLVEDTEGYWNMDIIGTSQGGRPLLRLSNTYGEEGSDRPGLYLLARQHAAETSGSWVLDGFLRHIATLGDNAPLVWCVPLANIDGVQQGDYGKDNFPYDLNRAWGTPPMRHEVLVFQRDMGRWARHCNARLGLDFHAPGACETRGIYVYLPDPAEDSAAYRAVTSWVDVIEESLGAEYAAAEFGRVAHYPSRWETPRFSSYGWHRLGVPYFTFENPYAMVGDQVLTRADYREAGKRIAQGVITVLEQK